jgi:uncharacterized protein DUF3800
MLIFFDETFRVYGPNPSLSLGALCGIALPEADLARISYDLFLLKLKHFGPEYASEREVKGKDIFKHFVFKLERRGIRSRNLAFADDLLDYMHQRKLRVFGCVCFEKKLQKFRVEDVVSLDKTFRYVFERVDIYLKLECPGHFAKLVFDDRDFDTNQRNAEAMTRFFQRSSTGLALESIVATPFFAISQAQNAGLQLADFVTTIIGMRFSANEDIKPFFGKLKRLVFEHVNAEGVRVSGLKVIRS